MSGFSIRRLVAEVHATAALAAPLVLGQLAAVGMTAVDSILAGQHGGETLAAVSVGGAVWSLVILVLIGVLMALPPTISQLHGAGQPERIGHVYRQALWLGLALGLMLLVCVRQSAPLLEAVGIAADVRPGATAFLLAASWGAPGLALYFCCRYVSEGLFRTRPTMVFGVLALLLLIPIGYVLLFGYGVIAGLGAAGLGYATAIVTWLQALGFLVYLRRSRRYRGLQLFSNTVRPDLHVVLALLRVGLPMGVTLMMEGGLFVATSLVIGGLGAVPAASHQIALNLVSLCFMVPLGVAMATTVRVAYSVGRGDGIALRWAGAAGYVLVLITQTGTAGALICFGNALAGLYTHDAVVLALAVELVALAAVFQWSDGLQALSSGALRGLKDTRMPMFITAIAYWGMGMPLGLWIGLSENRGAPGLWIGLIVGLSVAAVLLTVRFLSLMWRWRPQPDEPG